ncbi:hypothetical protein GPALN_014652 [Globodera pallida]|nr:hypothetical protein GPALN_014652 [Globodera pallida]
MEVKLKSPCNCFPPPPPYSETNQQPAGDRPPPLSAQLPQQQAVTATPPQVQQPQQSTVRKWITLIFCFLLPPISVALHNGPYKTINLRLNIILYFNGWLAILLSRDHLSIQQNIIYDKMPSGNAIVNSSACFQPVAQLSILNICPSAPVLSDELLRRKAAKEATFLFEKKETMDPDEFVQTLCTFSPISVSESEGRQIFDKLSVQHGNPVVVAKMVEELMPPLKAQRRALVEEVFRKMGSPKDTGSVPLSALCALFNHRRQPEFESGTKSREELLASFLATFEPDPDGQVLNIEFVAFYAAKSVAVPTDLHFDWMLRNQWKI